MVVLSEVGNMFWGVTLDGGKHYSQTVERSFHISMAALEPNTEGSGKAPVSVMIQHDKAEFMLCSLEQGRMYQQALDLNFTEGEEVSFFLNGKGIVHLTGYLVEDENMMSDMADLDNTDYSMEDVSDSESDSDTAPELVTPDVSDSSEDEEGTPESARKRKKQIKDKPGNKRAKVVVMEEDESDDDDDSDEEDGDASDKIGVLSFAMADFDDSDDDDEDYEDEEIDEEIVQQIKAKTVKSEKKPKSERKSSKLEKTPKSEKKSLKSENTPRSEKKSMKSENTPKSEKKSASSVAPTGVQKATPQKEELKQNGSDTPESKKKKKKKKNKEQSESKPGPGGDASSHKDNSTTPAKKSVLAGGTLCEEVKMGHGPEARPGKMVHVYYTGILGKNGQQFDSCTGGKPFKFRLGKQEVISGWDTGLIGMKVGGKRKLTVPPQQGYGNQRTGPIPPNSTLVFDIELKAVS